MKLRRAALGEHLREERGSKEAATQTDSRPPEEAMSPLPFRPQMSAQTPRQRAESVLQTQSQACDMPSAFHAHIAIALHSLHSSLDKELAASRTLQPRCLPAYIWPAPHLCYS